MKCEAQIPVYIKHKLPAKRKKKSVLDTHKKSI